MVMSYGQHLEMPHLMEKAFDCIYGCLLSLPVLLCAQFPFSSSEAMPASLGRQEGEQWLPLPIACPLGCRCE